MKKSILFSLAFLAIFFVSCDPTDPDPEPEPVDNELSGDISTDVTLDATVEYVLTGSLQVIDGGILRIPAGTVIKAEKGFNKYILVEMGGMIYINGTPEAPVVMTSGEASPAFGDWGGLIINGKAILSGPDGETATSTAEINPSVIYGGNVDNDNSGEIEYLILEYTGAKSSADIEHNGLTLNGVGRGTKIENVFVVDAADDGIEFFGGSVSVKNLLVVNSEDDMFDVTQGWSGTLDNAYGIWESGYTSSEGDPRGMELDGNLDGNTPNDVNQSDFTLQNITVENRSTFVMQDAVKVRRGAKATITNLLVKGGTCTDLIDMTDGKGNGNLQSSVSYKKDGVTVAGTEVKNPDQASITESASNTGASTSAFAWTGYTF
jgi:hypothetical protein